MDNRKSIHARCLKRNNAITLSRVTGMFLIVLCHIVKYYWFIPGHNELGQFFNCGVQLFIYISGYLYGNRIIDNVGSFYLKRIQSVALPTIIVSIITIILLLVVGCTVSISSIIAYCFDLEGLLFLNWPLVSSVFSEIASLGPLWFTTIVMLCYLFVPLLQRISREKITKKHSTIFIIVLIVLGTLFCILIKSVIELSFFLWFIVGYFSGKNCLMKKVNANFLIVYSLLFIISVIVRIVLHQFFDGSDFYVTYSNTAQFVLGTWFVVFFSYLNNRINRLINRIANNKIVRVIDNYSFYVYLVHGVFCMGVFNLYEKFPLIIATAMFFILTISSAFVIKAICSFLRAKSKS